MSNSLNQLIMQAKKPKILDLALTAVKNLKEVNGASPLDICNYISSTYNIPRDVAKRQTLLALKRGTAHGILKESGGRYSLLTDTEKECVELTNQELGLLDLACRRRRMMQRKRKAMKKAGKVSGKVKKKGPMRKSSKGRSGRSKSRKRGRSSSKKSGRKRSKSRKMKGRSKSKSRGNKIRSCTCPSSRREKHKHRSSSRKRRRDKKIRKSSRSRKRSKSKRKHRRSESRARKKEKKEKRKSSKRRGKKGRRDCDCPPSVRGRPEGSKAEGNVNKEKQKDKHKKDAKKDLNEKAGAKKENYFYELFKMNFGNRNQNNSPKLTATNN